MTGSESILCPECGWTGERGELTHAGDDRECPICANVIEFVE